jgi:DNA-binding transcriptional MerR regulator
MAEQRVTSMKLDELAERAGVSPRTVRYYVQRGILPAPEFRGPETAYSREHLVRLKAIRVLQERHQPLDVIQEILSKCGIAEVERIAKGEVPTGVDVTVPVAQPRPDPVARWARHIVVPGLEIHLQDGASPEVRALAEALLRHAEKEK